MKRIFFFIITNIAILLVLSIFLSLLGFTGILQSNGIDLDYDSLMLFSNQEETLLNAIKLLRKDGMIIFTQTFENKKNSIFVKCLKKIKPLLKYLTTIDFGKITIKNEFIELLERINLKIILDEEIKTSQILQRKGARIIIVKPKNK